MATIAASRILITLSIVLMASVAVANEREWGFFDVYGGPAGLLESDVPDWKFGHVATTVGARAGVWITDTWAVTFRGWYFQTDATQRESSPSDLAFLGMSLELLGRWQLDRRWALYGSLGPALAITTLDLQRADRSFEDDARSIAPGVSAGAGIEARLVGRFRGFAELHGSLVYPSLHFSDRTISPRLLNLDGLLGLRIGF